MYTFEQQLSKLCNLYQNYKLSSVSTIKIGGCAKYYAQVHSIKQLRKIIILCSAYNVKYYVIGNASNILFSDNGFDGVIISLKGLNKVRVNKNRITAHAGAFLGNVAYIAKNNGLSGLEWSVGIPATIGGAVAANAGAFNGDISKVLSCVCAMDINTCKLKKFNNLEYLGKYHKSLFTKNYNYVIIYAVFNLTKTSVKLIQQKTLQVILKRQQMQKVGYPSLGSVFSKLTNGVSPAFYIEQSGLKGKTIGDAQVSKVHSGYIVNIGNATFDDVLCLIKFIQNKIKKDWGVALTPEIIIIGD